MRKVTYQSLLAVLLIAALLSPVTLAEGLEVTQGAVDVVEDIVPQIDAVDAENAALPVSEVPLVEALELEQETVDAADVPQPIGAEDTAVANGASKLSVSKKKTVELEVGKRYQIVVPGKKIKSCKSANSKIVKATAKGLLTIVKQGKTKVTVKPVGGKAFVLTVKANKTTDLISYVMADYEGFNKLISRFKLKMKKGRESSAVFYSNGVLEVMIGDNYGDVTIPAKAGKKYSLDGVNPTMTFKQAAELLTRKGWNKGYSDSTVCYYDKIKGDMEYSIALKKKTGGRLASISGGFSGL